MLMTVEDVKVLPDSEVVDANAATAECSLVFLSHRGEGVGYCFCSPDLTSESLEW